MKKTQKTLWLGLMTLVATASLCSADEESPARDTRLRPSAEIARAYTLTEDTDIFSADGCVCRFYTRDGDLRVGFQCPRAIVLNKDTKVILTSVRRMTCSRLYSGVWNAFTRVSTIEHVAREVIYLDGDSIKAGIAWPRFANGY